MVSSKSRRPRGRMKGADARRLRLALALSLAEVSRALGVNGKYLTRVFTRAVGQRMHACRLLLATDRPVKAIAVHSGFRQAEGFRRVFHEHVGVPPATYRRIFTAA